MEIYQIVLIVFVISIVLSIILYVRQSMINSSIRAEFEQVNQCKFNEKEECINSSGKREWGKGITPPEDEKMFAATTSMPVSTTTFVPTTTFAATTSMPVSTTTTTFVPTTTTFAATTSTPVSTTTFVPTTTLVLK